MSNEAPNWFQEQWNGAVTHVYQSKGYLTRGMTTPPVRVTGKKMHFPIAGKAEAQDYARGDKVKTMNATRGEVLLDATEWDAADYIYQPDLDRMLPNEVDAVRETAAMALGRKHDTVLFDKLREQTYVANADPKLNETIGTYADTALPGPPQLLKGRRALVAKDVPTEDGAIYCGLPPLVFDNMMSFKVFSDANWVGGDLPFASNVRRKTWQQVNFFELPEFLHTYPAANQGRFFMWHKAAIGSGFTGEQIRTAWDDEVAQWKRWFYRSTLSAGVTVIQRGFIEFKYNSSLEPTFT